MLPRDGWRVLSRSASDVVFGTPRGSEQPGRFWFVHVTKRSGGWQDDAYGECNLVAALPEGLGVGQWELAGPRPGPDATVLRVLVHERQCSSGRSAEGRIRVHDIAYADDTITITLAVRALPATRTVKAAPRPPSRSSSTSRS